MDKEKLMEAMGHIDPAMVEVAAMSAARPRRRWLRPALIAACLCLLLVGTAVAVEVLNALNVTEIFSVARPDGEVVSGYTVQGGIVQLPLDKLSDEALDFAAGQMRLPVTKDCESWSAAEKFLGIEVANNSLLDQLEPVASSGYYYGKEHPYRCGVTFSGACAAPSFIHMDVTYAIGADWKAAVPENGGYNDATTVSVSAEIHTDEALDISVDRERSYYFMGAEVTVLEDYLTPSGLAVTIVEELTDDDSTAAAASGRIFTELQNTKTYYWADFALNGVIFQVFSVNTSDPDLALETLKQVLDAYE